MQCCDDELKEKASGTRIKIRRTFPLLDTAFGLHTSGKGGKNYIEHFPIPDKKETFRVWDLDHPLNSSGQARDHNSFQSNYRI